MDASGAAARPGRLLRLAKYEVREEIGHGGMATVYRAHDPRLGRDVALKVIHPHLRDSPEVAHRFFVEAKAVAKLRHPNIVEVFDVSGEDEDEQYLVVELLRGLTLRKLMQKHGPLPPEVAAALGVELLNALGHAHELDVVHRDVKPENVMLEHRPPAIDDGAVDPPAVRASPAGGTGDRVAVKLTDFGIAKLLDAQGVTSTGQVLGSPAHMAPEQIEGGDVDARADIFALGVLLYECMVGHLPFEGNNPAQVLRRVLEGIYPAAEQERPTVGQPWSKILDCALAHDPAERYADARAMREAMLAELTRVGVTSSRAELEAWSDDPAGYVEGHDARVIAKLCANAAAARARGDALVAAADYNRALAYAPNDPALLKVVSSMHAAETRARLVKRGAHVLGVMLLLGASAFALTTVLKPKIVAEHPRTPTSSTGLSSTTAPPRESAAPSALASEAPTASEVKKIPALIKLPSALPKEQKRSVTVSVSRPQQGVLAALDTDSPAPPPSPGTWTFVADNRPHTVHITCVQDLCVPQDRSVPEGDKDVALSTALEIRPAFLVIEGDANASYQVLQRPNLVVRVGAQNKIPLKDGYEFFTVKQLPSDKTQSVRLDAGKTGKVTFTD